MNKNTMAIEDLTMDEVEKLFNEYMKDEEKAISSDYKSDLTSFHCKYCSNNPKNGGSGFCLCTLGTPKVT